ncbi:NUDIX domain-containing protein [Chloroflexota bacterium]
MGKEHRISAGAITIKDGKILLVRYNDKHGSSFLAGPGGGIHYDDETLLQALTREVMEETGLEVNPYKLLFIEDLLPHHYRMIKIWFLCEVAGGKLERTQGAIDEGITEAGWYTRDELNSEVVYPPPVMEEDWESFFADSWKAGYLELREADF